MLPLSRLCKRNLNPSIQTDRAFKQFPVVLKRVYHGRKTRHKRSLRNGDSFTFSIQIRQQNSLGGLVEGNALECNRVRIRYIGILPRLHSREITCAAFRSPKA